jgi:hypothetical protein
MNPLGGFFHLWTKLVAEQSKVRAVQAGLHLELRRLFGSTLNDIITIALKNTFINLCV